MVKPRVQLETLPKENFTFMIVFMGAPKPLPPIISKALFLYCVVVHATSIPYIMQIFLLVQTNLVSAFHPSVCSSVTQLQTAANSTHVGTRQSSATPGASNATPPMLCTRLPPRGLQRTHTHTPARGLPPYARLATRTRPGLGQLSRALSSKSTIRNLRTT